MDEQGRPKFLNRANCDDCAMEFRIESSGPIMSLADYLVGVRCRSDYPDTHASFRHCCGIFVEKSRYCFKSAFNRNKSRMLQRKKRSSKFFVPRRKVHPCRRDGPRQNTQKQIGQNNQSVHNGNSDFNSIQH